IGRRLARALEAHGARRRPGNGVALRVGDGDHSVVEGRVHVRDPGGDVLAFASADAGSFLAHSRSFRGSAEATPSPHSIRWPYAVATAHELLLLAGNSFRRTLAGARIGMRPLAAHR